MEQLTLINKIREYQFQYRLQNKAQRKYTRNIWLKNNKSAHISEVMVSRLSHFLRIYERSGKINNSYVFDYIGLSGSQFIKYIESKFRGSMSFVNYGKGGWTIDHIIPRIKFDHTKESERYKCWNYKNIQPLWVMENSIKGASHG